jgi:hypothetical protein
MSEEGPSVPELKLLAAEEFSEYLDKHKFVPRYDSVEEKKLDHPYWSLPTTQIGITLRSIDATLSGILQKISSGDRELQQLLKETPRIPRFERNQTTSFALIGEQGHGKSMLINALFDLEGISLTGKKGKAHTCTVIRYAQYTANEDHPTSAMYHAEIRFHTADKLLDMIREHVKNYLHYHNEGEDLDDDFSPGDQSYEKDDMDRQNRDTAREMFQTLFGSRDDFLDCWGSEQTKEFESICLHKCNDMIREYKPADNAIFEHGTTPAELMGKIRRFMVSEEGSECLWPLVDQVTIRFDHPLLRLGVIVMDVPGMLSSQTPHHSYIPAPKV